jgi:hypothetical protein
MPGDEVRHDQPSRAARSRNDKDEKDRESRMREMARFLGDKDEGVVEAGSGTTYPVMISHNHRTSEVKIVRWVQNGRVTFDKSEHDKGSKPKEDEQGTSKTEIEGKFGWLQEVNRRLRAEVEESSDTQDSEPNVRSDDKGKGVARSRAAFFAFMSQPKEATKKQLAVEVETSQRGNGSKGVVEDERSSGKSDRVRLAEALKASRQSHIEAENDVEEDHSGWFSGRVKFIRRG